MEVVQGLTWEGRVSEVLWAGVKGVWKQRLHKIHTERKGERLGLGMDNYTIEVGKKDVERMNIAGPNRSLKDN